MARRIVYKNRRKRTENKYKRYLNYMKHVYRYGRKVFRAFIIKNILIYPEDFDNSSSFAIEFDVVNKVFKRPLILKLR